MADDIERYLGGRPVHAHPPSRWYRAQKFINRHRGAVGITTTLALAVLASLGIALWQAHEAREQAQRATTQAARADEVKTFVLSLFDAAQEELPKGERPTPDVLVRIAAKRIDENKLLDTSSRVDMLIALAKVSISTSNFDQAIQFYVSARAATMHSNLPNQRSQLLEIDALQADALFVSGKVDEAARLLEPVLPELQALDRDVSSNAFITLAQIRMAQARPDEAIAAADTGALIAARAYPANTRDQIAAMAAPAQIRILVGRIGEARPMLAQEIKRWDDAGISHDDTYIRLLTALTYAEYQLGNPEQALADLDRCIELIRSIHARPGDTLIQLLENRATLLTYEDHIAEAKASADEALEIARNVYAPESREILSLQFLVAGVALMADGPSVAVPQLQALIAACQRTDAETSNPQCARAHLKLGAAFAQLRRFDDAEAELLRGVALHRAIFGEQHVEYAIAEWNLGKLRADQGRHGDALEVFDDALAIWRASKQTNNHLGDLQFWRALTLHALGRDADALAAIDDAIAVLTRYEPRSRLARIESRAHRALILQALGRAAEARDDARRALESDLDSATLLPDMRAALEKLVL
jgi:eukaryotic-like serine/threonine-protein kinase